MATPSDSSRGLRLISGDITRSLISKNSGRDTTGARGFGLMARAAVIVKINPKTLRVKFDLE
jgi:hypothetical protein